MFDGVAAEYDAVRPGYPLELVDAAVAAGSLDRDSAVLEIGCGTGKLTELLLARGLHVHAVEPGANLVEVARTRLGATGAVEFEIARFEDVRLPEAGFDAVFSATAFHWIEPAVGWRKVAALLKADGLLALLAHIAVHDERSAAMEEEMFRLVREHGPANGMDWTIPSTLEATLAAAHAQTSNVSAVWDVIMTTGKTRPHGARSSRSLRGHHADHSPGEPRTTSRRGAGAPPHDYLVVRPRSNQTAASPSKTPTAP